jgi:hypothetical protein
MHVEQSTNYNDLECTLTQLPWTIFAGIGPSKERGGTGETPEPQKGNKTYCNRGMGHDSLNTCWLKSPNQNVVPRYETRTR